MTLTLQGNGTLNGLTVLGAPVTTLANTGTAASPSLVFDGDSDTGLFRPGANQLALSVGGSARLTIASDGTTTFTNLETSAGSLTFGDYSSTTASSVKIWNNNSYGLYINGTGNSAHTAVGVYKVDSPAGYQARIFHDGSAIFSGELNVGGYDGGSTTTDGVLLGATGGVFSQMTAATAGTGVLFQGMHGNTFTSRITANGAATFASTMHTGSGSADSRITIGSHGTAGTNDSVHVRADSANLLFMCGSGGITKFEQNGTLQLVIDANRNVGINQATPTSQSGKVLHISGDTGGQARIHLTTSASGHGANEGSYIIAQGAESGATAGQLSITNLENRDIVFGTGTSYTEKLRIQNAGGISFNGDTATANALDDYEEGTWTPTGNHNFNNITLAEGYYTKVGKIVTVNFQFYYGSLDNSGTYSAVAGLPFQPGDYNANTGVEATNSIFGTNKLVFVYVNSGTNILYFETSRPVAGSSSTAGDFFRGSITYMT